MEIALQGQGRSWPDPHWELLLISKLPGPILIGSLPRSPQSFWVPVTVPAAHNPPSQPLSTLTFSSDEVPVPTSLNVSQVEKTTKTKGAEKILKLLLFIVTKFGGNIPFSVNILTLTLIKMRNEVGNKILYDYVFQKCNEAKRAGTGDHSRPHEVYYV